MMAGKEMTTRTRRTFLLVRGLLKNLPPEGSAWASQERVKWLEQQQDASI